MAKFTVVEKWSEHVTESRACSRSTVVEADDEDAAIALAEEQDSWGEIDEGDWGDNGETEIDESEYTAEESEAEVEDEVE